MRYMLQDLIILKLINMLILPGLIFSGSEGLALASFLSSPVPNPGYFLIIALPFPIVLNSEAYSPGPRVYEPV